MKTPPLILLSLLGIITVVALSCASADDALDKGNEFFEVRQYEEAVEEYTEALRIDPEYAGAYYNRGYAYYLMGRYDRSIADYSESLRLEPDDVDAYIRRGTPTQRTIAVSRTR